MKMISDGQESIILVGYVMTDDENQDIFDALKRTAKERHVKIRIIFDRATKPKKCGKWAKSPKWIITKMWGDIEHFPEIYSYDDDSSSQHAKFLAVDGKEILITSANMTDRAMTRNLEIGIRHLGEIANDVTKLIEMLIEKQIISEIKYG